jgi:hypothetical protein
MFISYSINDYDGDGNLYDKGIFLHFNDIRLKIAKDREELKKFFEAMENLKKHLLEEEK